MSNDARLERRHVGFREAIAFRRHLRDGFDLLTHAGGGRVGRHFLRADIGDHAAGETLKIVWQEFVQQRIGAGHILFLQIGDEALFGTDGIPFLVSGPADLKALHKQIVMSATYRQDSDAPPALVAKDPENRLLARGPRHRLSAEQIRDSALWISGLLNPAMGGPSVKPYQPAGVWEEAGTGKTYTQDHGDKLYRRSLYTFIRRTAPPPAMLTFDAGSREVCTANREITATPLQSLVLLNDTQFIEAARVLAERLWRQAGGSDPDRLARGFLEITGRKPDAEEQKILVRLYDEQHRQFAKDPGAAERLLKSGERVADATLPPADLAAATMVVSTLMNHDEFVMKR